MVFRKQASISYWLVGYWYSRILYFFGSNKNKLILYCLAVVLDLESCDYQSFSLNFHNTYFYSITYHLIMMRDITMENHKTAFTKRSISRMLLFIQGETSSEPLAEIFVYFIIYLLIVLTVLQWFSACFCDFCIFITNWTYSFALKRRGKFLRNLPPSPSFQILRFERLIYVVLYFHL